MDTFKPDSDEKAFGLLIIAGDQRERVADSRAEHRRAALRALALSGFYIAVASMIPQEHLTRGFVYLACLVILGLNHSLGTIIYSTFNWVIKFRETKNNKEQSLLKQNQCTQLH